jgi:hypothetical protein
MAPALIPRVVEIPEWPIGELFERPAITSPAGRPVGIDQPHVRISCGPLVVEPSFE